MDWLATIGRSLEPFVVDRPLVNQVKASKILPNLLARWVEFSYKTFDARLRPIHAARDEDVLAVRQQIDDLVKDLAKFSASPSELIQRQKNEMMKIKSNVVKMNIVGTYKSFQAASKQVDLLLLGHQDVRVNIVPSENGYTVHTIHAQ